MLNVLLVDIDSKIPNLALMKLSTMHKNMGHNVILDKKGRSPLDFNPDFVYISVVFKANVHKIDAIRKRYPDAAIDVGGTGVSLEKKLDDTVEYLKPDYSLYPDWKSSIGFSTRGCNRNCYFCVVTQKEGDFHTSQHPSKWYNPDYDSIVFLDNNILLDKEWFMCITQWCIDKELAVEFNQGLDIRLVDESVASRLSELKLHKTLKFAWDDIRLEPVIREKIQLLLDCGLSKSKLRSYTQFYVYMDSEDEYDSAVYRCRTLKELRTSPFVMFNIDHDQSQKVKDLRRWANNKIICWACDIADYDRSKWK